MAGARSARFGPVVYQWRRFTSAHGDCGGRNAAGISRLEEVDGRRLATGGRSSGMAARVGPLSRRDTPGSPRGAERRCFARFETDIETRTDIKTEPRPWGRGFQAFAQSNRRARTRLQFPGRRPARTGAVW